MRQLGSKLLAGGLSAGVVLLWWPLFFPTDSVATWLGRGIVWTLSFELLLVALSPFELALWNTTRGERISQRVASKRSLLDHESPKRRLGRRAALALGALALPLALIGLGVSKHIPTSHAATPPKVTQVTRVVRVVKPVRVERVVKVRTVRQEVPAQSVYSAPVATSPSNGAGSTTKKQAVKKPAATPVSPKAHAKLPTATPETAPSTPSGSGTQTQSPASTTGSTDSGVQPPT